MSKSAGRPNRKTWAPGLAAIPVALSLAVGALLMFAPSASAIGPGTVSVNPTSVAAQSSARNIDFLFSPGTSTAVDVTIAVPPGWTSAQGKVSLEASTGQCTASPTGTATAITFRVSSCNNANGSVTIRYQGTTTAAGSYTFTTSSRTGTNAYEQLGSSPTITVTPAAASKLAFTQQPSGGTTGDTWATQPQVTVQDTFGNRITGSTAAITLSSGAGGFACTTNPLNATAGIATFAGCKAVSPGTGYTLTATSGTLTSATSSAFNVDKYALTLTGSSPQTYFRCTSTSTGQFGVDVTFTASGFRSGASPKLVIGSSTFDMTLSGTAATYKVLKTQTVGICPAAGPNRQITVSLDAVHGSPAQSLGSGSGTYTTTLAD